MLNNSLKLVDDSESFALISLFTIAINRPAKRLYDSSDEDGACSEDDRDSRPPHSKVTGTPKQNPITTDNVFSPPPRMAPEALREVRSEVLRPITPLSGQSHSETPSRSQPIGQSKLNLCCKHCTELYLQKLAFNTQKQTTKNKS